MELVTDIVKECSKTSSETPDYSLTGVGRGEGGGSVGGEGVWEAREGGWEAREGGRGGRGGW